MWYFIGRYFKEKRRLKAMIRDYYRTGGAVNKQRHGKRRKMQT